MQLGAGHGADHQLSDAIAAADVKWFLSVVDEEHLHLAAVVGVDGAWCVKHGDAVFEREPGAGPDLAFKAFWQRDGVAGWNEPAFAGHERDGLGDCGTQVHACSMRGLVGGEGDGDWGNQDDRDLNNHRRETNSISGGRAQFRDAFRLCEEG